MREVSVFFNKTLAGKLTEESAQSYVFEYDKSYLANSDNPSIAYEFPKTQTKFRSNALFPFFANLLPETRVFCAGCEKLTKTIFSGCSLQLSVRIQSGQCL